ncbi:MAG: DNA polymerase IV, partial [Armatimonadota bacterium]|nr:DNA polymerase IV [Armatimonadota bacterium]
PTDQKDFLFAQMARNLENACTKARRYELVARRLFLYMRRQDFNDFGVEIRLTRPTAYPMELLEALREGFQQIYRPGTLYRATGVVLSGLIPVSSLQFGLFDDRVQIERIVQVYRVIDGLAEKFGKHTVHHGASHSVELHAQHEGERGDIPTRKRELFKGENKRQRLGLPVLSVPV